MNAGTTMRARSDVRSRMASLIAVTLLVGVAGAVSIAAFTGAERAEPPTSASGCIRTNPK